MNDYFNQREAMGVALFHAGRCALNDGIENLQGRLKELDMYAPLMDALALLDSAREMALGTCKDEDYRKGLERRIATYKIGLTHVKPECEELHVVASNDMQTLVGHALNYCDLECPCVSVDDTGERAVIREAVKACEMRRMYKRLLVSESASAECPYSMMI